MTLLVSSAFDISVILAIGLAITACLRRRSAALRHAVLASAVVAASVAPAIEALAPPWRITAPWAPSASVTTSGLEWSSAPVAEPPATDAPAAAPISIEQVLALIWIAGLFVTGGGLLLGLIRLVRITARSTPIHDPVWRAAAETLVRHHRLRRPIELRETPDPSLIVTWGFWRPRVLLPAGAAAWDAERRRVVLTHEVAHIRRGDWGLQLTAEVLRAAFWFSPLAWIACHRLRQDSECACDDAVLETGVDAPAYAAHLLAVAREAVGAGARAYVPAVAHPSTLERRIAAMLNEDRTRRPPAFLTCAAALLGMLLMSVPIAALKVTPSAAAPTVRATVGPDVTLLPAVVDTVATTRPRTSPVPNASRVAAAAQQTPAGVTGVVVDPSGAVLPGVEVTLTDAVGIKYGAVTDGQGEFALNDLPPGRYEMVTSLPGFSPLTNVFNLAAGSRLARRFMLPVGSVEETLTVVCTAGAPGRPLAINQRVRTVPVERIWDFGSVRRAMASSAPELAMQAPLAPGRVGGQLRPPRKLRNANPVCPPLLLPADDAIANFVGRIGIDGYMNAVRHVPADSSQAHVPPEFIEAAMDAIREWAFTPTLLNGQPIEVEMTVAVRFRRG